MKRPLPPSHARHRRRPLEKNEGEWEIEVHIRGLRFKVELASHRTCQADYNKNVGKFLDHHQTADPPLGGLSVDSYTTEVAPSQSRTPGPRPVYFHEWKLGKGSYGQVDRVVDVSTDAVYARKKFSSLRRTKTSSAGAVKGTSG